MVTSMEVSIAIIVYIDPLNCVPQKNVYNIIQKLLNTNVSFGDSVLTATVGGGLDFYDYQDLIVCLST